MSEWFRGRKLVIASKHKKEKAIAPRLKRELQVDILVPDNFDTDQYGTFSGEIERVLTPLEAARRKCLTAMKLTGADLAVSSEGSFGPHPTLFFTPGDDELVFLYDKKHDLEILGRAVSTETNFAGKEVYEKKDLLDFASAAGFPSHALLLRKGKDDLTYLEKGIQTQERLIEVFEKILRINGSAFVETDMRALYNPTRMKVIGDATDDLIRKIRSRCPNCNTPGFEVTKFVKGLPCSLCGSDTNSVKAEIYSCKKCEFTEENEFPKGKTEEDPMYCNFCNP